jgi:purine-binding chemotaxis protein CheW
MPRKKPIPEAIEETPAVAAEAAVEVAPAQLEAETVVPEDVVADEAPVASETPADACAWLDRAVAFYLAGQRYALPIDRVQEIQQIVAFSEVPGGGLGIVGMVNLRGHVIPAVDVRSLVGLGRQEYTLETPMIICRVRGHLIALVVDEVEDVLELPEGCLQAAPPMHALASKMVGVARLETGLVYVLDLDLLLGAGFTAWGV